MAISPSSLVLTYFEEEVSDLFEKMIDSGLKDAILFQNEVGIFLPIPQDIKIRIDRVEAALRTRYQHAGWKEFSFSRECKVDRIHGRYVELRAE